MNFYYSNIYSVIAGIAIIIHLIINWRQLFGWRKEQPRAWTSEFRRFLFFLLLFFAADFMWGILAAQKCARLLYMDTVVFFALMALTVSSWVRFVVAYLDVAGMARSCLRWAGRVMLAYIVAALAVNAFTGVFFVIDGESRYIEGPLRNLMFWLQVALDAISVIITFCKLLNSHGAVRRRNAMVFAFGLTMTVAIVLQIDHPFLPIYALGCLLGCCLMHVFVFEDERDEMLQNEIMTRDYAARLKAEQEANRAKSLFFSSVSHDIRTPLNAILGFSELLEQGVNDEDARKNFISSIRASGKVLARLVDDVLDLSKLESGKMEIAEEPTDMPALVREVIASCEVARAQKSLDLRSEICEMPCVSVDPFRIRQILCNLLSNAYKYSSHGTVTVSLRWESGTLILSVADTGVGISQENLERILQPFFQVVDKNNRNGTGLGLPICNKLVTLMGGELSIASKVGEGSTFTVTLPNVRTVERPSGGAPAPAADGAAEPAAAAEPSPALSALRVLVVDDSRVNRVVLKAMLVNCGVHDVEMAENGRDALARLKDGSKYDIVFSDLWMPEMDGRDLVRAIRADAALANLPVCLITADVDARDHAKEEGFTAVILKPVSLAKLHHMLAGFTAVTR